MKFAYALFLFLMLVFLSMGAFLFVQGIGAHPPHFPSLAPAAHVQSGAIMHALNG